MKHKYKLLIVVFLSLFIIGLVSSIPYVKLGEGVNITTYSSTTPLTLSNYVFGLMACSDTQILKYSVGSSAWLCQADSSGVGNYTNSSFDLSQLANTGNIDIGNYNLNTTGNLSYKTIYAQLSDLKDQTFAATGTKQAINLTTTDEIFGLSVSESNITIQRGGIYYLAAQPQVSTGAGGAGTFHMWLEKHDTTQWVNVSNSNVELVLASNEQNVIPLITTLSLDANEKIRLMGSVSDTAIKLDSQAPTGEPVIPSIIFTMFKLGE